MNTVRSIEENADGLLETRFCLYNYLTADATRTDRLICELTIGATSSDGKFYYSLIGILSTGREDG